MEWMEERVVSAMTQWRIERRLLGWRILAMPILAATGITGLAVLGQVGGGSEAVATILLTSGIEIVIPLAAAIVTTFVVGNDPALELQLSLPVRYRTTFFRRMLLATIPPGMTALVMAHLLMATGQWVAPTAGLAGDLVWVAPLAWMTGAAGALTVLLRSSAGAVALVTVLAAAEVLLHDLFVSTPWLRPVFLPATTAAVASDFWWMNRVDLLAMAALATALTGLLLSRPARLLMEEPG
jgi:hypothetical protein